VAGLPEGIREAVYLYYYEAESVGAVARALGVTRAAARKRLERGRDLLRETLWRELGRTLRECRPSREERRRKARAMALAVLGSIPLSLAARAGTACLPSAPLAGTAATAPAATAVVLGGIIVGTKLKLLIIVAAIILIVMGGFFSADLHRGKDVPAPPIAEGPGRAAPAGPEIAGAGGAAGEKTAAGPTGDAGPGAAAPAVLRIRVENPEGKPVEDARVAVAWLRKMGEWGFADSGSEDVPRSPSGEHVVRERKGDIAACLVASPRFFPKTVRQDVPEEGIPDPIAVVLEPGETFTARIVCPLP
jgi:hypothetical protein